MILKQVQIHVTRIDEMVKRVNELGLDAKDIIQIFPNPATHPGDAVQSWFVLYRSRQ